MSRLTQLVSSELVVCHCPPPSCHGGGQSLFPFCVLTTLGLFYVALFTNKDRLVSHNISPTFEHASQFCLDQLIV